MRVIAFMWQGDTLAARPCFIVEHALCTAPTSPPLAPLMP
jgi:hypothetical protein